MKRVILFLSPEIGTLWLKSEATCAAYWNRREQTKQTIQGHWISTGDKFYQDEDGYYRFAGRALEVESVLLEHEAWPRSRWWRIKIKDGLTKPVAWVVLRPGYEGSPDLVSTLLELVIARLPS
jgi:acyl-coenzyme A synthetase/AMP-(fatty) acid ligase